MLNLKLRIQSMKKVLFFMVAFASSIIFANQTAATIPTPEAIVSTPPAVEAQVSEAINATTEIPVPVPVPTPVPVIEKEVKAVAK
jgi:hypothetical protein